MVRNELECRMLPAFRRLVPDGMLREAERQDGSVYGIFPDYRLGYFNPAWVKFAQENGGAEWVWSGAALGSSVMDVTAEALQPFYRKLFATALQAQTQSLRPLQFRYQCHSDELYREFVMTFYPVGDAEGLLIANSLVCEEPYDWQERVRVAGRESEYMGADGLIRQCANCRRVEHLRVPHRWDWVPEWVKQLPPRSTHTICDMCMEHFYGEGRSLQRTEKTKAE